ncbi:MAG TPA: MEDS domain-containing protein [Chloroflexota bacterium]|nr:MEDS domain-containing protein [Chloroflexota bacterium]
MGVDVASETERGVLSILSQDNSYFSSGGFYPSGGITTIDQAALNATNAGFPGLRIAVEIRRILQQEADLELYAHYETMLNSYLPCSQVTILCLFDRAACSPATLATALKTHPTAILREHCCQNLYYEPPELLFGDVEANRIDWMISRIRQAREAGGALEEANAELLQTMEERAEELSIEIERRAEIEEALLEMNHTLKAMYEITPVAITALDTHNRVTLWNPAAERMMGWAQHEVRGLNYPTTPRPAFGDFGALKAAVMGGSGFANISADVTRRDGTIIQVNLSASPLRDGQGNINAVIMVMSDPIELEMAEPMRSKNGHSHAVA